MCACVFVFGYINNINSRAMCSVPPRCSPPPYHFHTWFFFLLPTSPHPFVVPLLAALKSLFPSRHDREAACRPALRFDVHPVHLARWQATAGGAVSLREYVTAAWLTISKWHACGMTRHYYSWNTQQKSMLPLHCSVHKCVNISLFLPMLFFNAGIERFNCSV